MSNVNRGLPFLILFPGHYYDGACTLSVIEESAGNQLTLCEWKLKLVNQKKKVHFSTNEECLDSENITKQVLTNKSIFFFVQNDYRVPNI